MLSQRVTVMITTKPDLLRNNRTTSLPIKTRNILQNVVGTGDRSFSVIIWGGRHCYFLHRVVIVNRRPYVLQGPIGLSTGLIPNSKTLSDHCWVSDECASKRQNTNFVVVNRRKVIQESLNHGNYSNESYTCLYDFLYYNFFSLQ